METLSDGHTLVPDKEGSTVQLLLPGMMHYGYSYQDKSKDLHIIL